MKALAPLLAETAADVYEGFEDWFAMVVRRSKKHLQHLCDYRQTAARFGLTSRLIAIMTLYTLAFRPTDPSAQRPKPGSSRSKAEHQASNRWIGQHELPGVYI